MTSFSKTGAFSLGTFLGSDNNWNHCILNKAKGRQIQFVYVKASTRKRLKSKISVRRARLWGEKNLCASVSISVSVSVSISASISIKWNYLPRSTTSKVVYQMLSL